MIILISSSTGFYLYSTQSHLKSIKPNSFDSFKINFINSINDQTNLFSIKLHSNQIQSPNHPFYVQSIYIKHPELQIERAYTNLNTIHSNQSSSIELLIKSYEDGEVSTYLKRFKRNQPNQSIEIRGPELNWCHPNDKLNEIIFIVGGTGISPVIQLLRRFYPPPPHSSIPSKPIPNIPKIKLIYLSNSIRSIYLHEELLNYVNLNPDSFQLFNLITQPAPLHPIESDPPPLVNKIGRLELQDLKRWIGIGSDQINHQRIILVCGPDSMVKAIAGPKAPDLISQGELGGMLKELGFHPEEVYKL
ncbi:hypothetical protein DFH28DRAFT_892500 [Melampsora americana]|nr:hypothetical protein DFH28DRAFT_892500 [Melampsora americana]